MRTHAFRASMILTLIACLGMAGRTIGRQPRTIEPPPLPALINVDQLRPAFDGPAEAPTDSLYLLGGPAVLSGKFQDAAGLPDRQGWTGIDLNQATESHWQVSSFDAADLDPGTPDNHAWWCGKVMDSCGGDDPPEGYGPDWIEYLDWYGTVPDPGSDVTVHIRAVLRYGFEPAEEYLHLQAFNFGTGSMENLATFSWNGPLEVVDVAAVLTPDYLTGESNDRVHLRWDFMSDGGWDDADCMWPSAGAAQLDLIQVHFDQGSGPVQVGWTETCEAGDPLQWVPTLPRGPGDFSKVWPQLDDADPAADNSTPQFAFIDDGSVVPGTGGYPCISYCYGPGGYIVNPGFGISDVYLTVDNEIWSPVLTVPSGGWDGAVFSFDHYVHSELNNGGAYVIGLWHVRSTADPDGLTGWSEWRDRSYLIWGDASYVREIQNVTDLLVPGFTHVQLALGVKNYYPYGPADGTPAPYFDNVSLKVYKNVESSALLVTPDGSGDYPTIQAAINAAANRDTVLLADGVFTGDGNRDVYFMGKEIVVCSQSGNPEDCVLDVEGAPGDNHRGFNFVFGEGPASVLSGVTIAGGFMSVTPDNESGGIRCDGSSPLIRDCIFDGNLANHGGALGATDNSSPEIINCLFTANEALTNGGAIYGYGSDVHLTIRSCTFSGNISPSNSGVMAAYLSRFDIDRTIIAFNTGGSATSCIDTADFHFSCTDIYGNAGGDWVGFIADQYGVDGNFSADPCFCDPTAGNYELCGTSPCLAENSPGECASIVGAFGRGCGPTSNTPPEDMAPAAINLIGAHPNPFNPRTVITYNLHQRTAVSLRVFDVSGRVVDVLLDGVITEPGRNEAAWQGHDLDGRPASAGVYFYRLEAQGYTETKKMVLMK